MKRTLSIFLGLAVAATAAAADLRPAAQWTKTESLWKSEPYQYDGAGHIVAVGTDLYRYDAAGRLIYATADVPPATGNAQTFTYDVYGNMTRLTTNSDGIEMPYGFAVDPSTNQLDGTCPTGVVGCFKGFYDEAGNQTGGVTNGEYLWDPLGALGELKGGRHERYLYDANDERIAVIRYDTSTTIELERRYTLRGLDKKVARELTYNSVAATWALTKDYVYRNGGVVASYSGNDTTPSRHYHLDHLGSTRLVTDSAGYKLAIHTYLPFGVEAPGSQTDAERLKFTGHERDSNPMLPGWDLDYMHARYYSPVAARFLSVDPGRDWDLHDPQSWNTYGYVRNNPINGTDPTGRRSEWARDVQGGEDATSALLAKARWGDPDESGYGLFGTSEYVNLRKVDRILVATLGLINQTGLTVLQALIPGPKMSGKAKARAVSGGIRVSERGLAIVERHLATLDAYPPNNAMIARLRAALQKGEVIVGADANFYLHEVAEATLMSRGVGYDAAHAAALQRYGVSEFSLYHPEVVNSFREWFSPAWRKFWGLRP